LIEPTSGSVEFDGVEINRLSSSQMRGMRRRMQIIFQDPFGSLNPRMTAADIIREPLKLHGLARGQELNDRVENLLDVVGLSSDHGPRYPHQFSGGQRQRIAIARALAVNPELIICDEAVSALDVSIQAQIINLLQDLQERLGLVYLFIAHDLAVVKHISQRVAVMYLGRIVELADCDQIYANPLHPYTRALLSAIPSPSIGNSRARIILHGEIPSPVSPPTGCHFHTRCPYVQSRCKEEIPVLRNAEGGHVAACHFFETLPPLPPETARGSNVSPAFARRLALFEQARDQNKDRGQLLT
jgi:oligopeptide transport system ATP-binding protein